MEKLYLIVSSPLIFKQFIFIKNIPFNTNWLGRTACSILLTLHSEALMCNNNAWSVIMVLVLFAFQMLM